MPKLFSSRLAAIGLSLAPAVALAADPATVPAPAIRAGDSWVYDRTFESGASGFAEQRVEMMVQRVGETTMIVGIKPEGAREEFQDHTAGLDWSHSRIVSGKETLTDRPLAFPLTLGKTWSLDYAAAGTGGKKTFARFHDVYRVVGWKDVAVPAGTFRVLEIDEDGAVQARLDPSAAAAVETAATHSQFYYSPRVESFVKSVEARYDSAAVMTSRDTQLLVSFSVRR